MRVRLRKWPTRQTLSQNGQNDGLGRRIPRPIVNDFWCQTFATVGQPPGATIEADEDDPVRVNAANICQDTEYYSAPTR